MTPPPAATLTPVAFSVDDDEHAESLHSVLVSLGYAPTRVQPGTLERVGLTLEHLTRMCKLTPREVEVVEALLSGARVIAEIAPHVGLSEQTVLWVTRSLKLKCAVDTLAEIPALLMQDTHRDGLPTSAPSRATEASA